MLMLIMSKNICELLGATEPFYSQAINQLEKEAGHSNEDIKLYSDIIAKIKLKTRELGLDPNDTTGKELYHALSHIVGLHDEFLAKAIGAKDPTDVAEVAQKIKKTVDKMKIPKNVWVIKHSVAKRLLKKMPPKNVMKQLGYRSIDSMLKRENISEIFGVLRIAENDKWLERFIGSYKKLAPSDFEIRKIEIAVLDGKRWGKLTNKFIKEKHHNITYLKEMGAVIILPMPIEKLSGVCITVFPLVLHYINEIRIYSAFFKFRQVRPDFGDILVETIINDPPAAAIVAGQPIHWRIIQRYWGRLDEIDYPEMFEPHVQVEDLTWHQAEDALFKIEPALKFWQSLDWIGVMADGRPISFNLMDMAVSYCNKLPYGQQAVNYMQNSLWNELFTRYLGQESLNRQVLQQLDEEMLTEA